MRVLFLNTTGGFFGGVEQNIYFAAEGLKARGHRCTFACDRQAGAALGQFEEPFARVWDLTRTTLTDAVENDRPDIIYVHKFDSIQRVYDAAGTVPVVRMYHDHDIYCPRRHKYYFYNQKICRRKAGIACYFDLAFLERGPKGISFSSIGRKIRELKLNHTVGTAIVGSSYMRGELIRNGFDVAKIRVLPPCVTVPHDEPTPLPEAPSVLYVGQIIRGKGVDILLRAHVLLQKRMGRKVPLEIIGTGNAEQHMVALAAELGLGASVTFHGWVPNDRLAPFYDAASLVVVPSRWPEPFGMIGIEAMLRGRPVVASRSGGIPDWLEDGKTGYLVPPNAPQPLAEKIWDLLSSPERAGNLGRAGYERARERYGYQAYIEQLESILEGGKA